MNGFRELSCEEMNRTKGGNGAFFMQIFGFLAVLFGGKGGGGGGFGGGPNIFNFFQGPNNFF